MSYAETVTNWMWTGNWITAEYIPPWPGVHSAADCLSTFAYILSDMLSKGAGQWIEVNGAFGQDSRHAKMSDNITGNSVSDHSLYEHDVRETELRYAFVTQFEP